MLFDVRFFEFVGEGGVGGGGTGELPSCVRVESLAVVVLNVCCSSCGFGFNRTILAVVIYFSCGKWRCLPKELYLGGKGYDKRSNNMRMHIVIPEVGRIIFFSAEYVFMINRDCVSISLS